MKICMVTSSYPRFPGDIAGTFIEALAAQVAEAGHEVHVIAPFDDSVKPVGRAGDRRHGPVIVHYFSYAPWNRLRVLGYGQSLEGDRRLRRLAYIMIAPYVAASLIRLRALAARYQFDVMHGHWVLPGGLIAAIGARRLGIPLIVTLHGSDVYVAATSGIFGAVARRVFRQARFVTACSRDLRDRAIALGAAADRTLTIPNGVSPAIGQTDPNAGSDVRRSLGMGDPNPVVVGLGRFVFKKGFEYLLDAWPLVVRDWPNARLVLGGDGHLFSSFEDRIRSLGVADTVRLPGRIPSDAVPRYLAAADVFVAPSIYDQSGNVDGMPVVVLEAMAAGKPIVATRVGGLAEVVQHGVNGLLVDERSPRAIADAIAMLLADPELRASYGARARDRVVEQFTWTTIARRFAELYREAGKRHECASFASFD